MSGWPELPGCPLHSGAPGFAGGTEPVTAGGAGAAGVAGARNGNHWLICAAAEPAPRVSAAAVQTAAIRFDPSMAISPARAPR